MINKKGLSYVIVLVCFVCAIGIVYSSGLRIFKDFHGLVEPSYMRYVLAAHFVSAAIWIIYMVACAKAEKVGKAQVIIAVIVLSSTMFSHTMLYTITDFMVHPEHYEEMDVSGNTVSESSISGDNADNNVQ